jgi:hypothetical protein
MAAVLAYPPGTVLSHRSAAGLWALRPDNRPRVEVSVPRRAARPKDGIEQHLAASLTADDITRVQGIPCTTVARTLVDLGDVASRRVIEYAVERTGPTHGRSLLYRVLEDLTAGSTLTESELEEAFLAISRTVGLRDPEVNVWMTLPDGTAVRIDFLWRKERLAVETDGGPYHRTPQARERDARRDQLLRLAGFEPVRFTDRAGGDRAGLGGADSVRADRAAAAASVPRRWRRIRQSSAAGCVRVTARRRPQP